MGIPFLVKNFNRLFWISCSFKVYFCFQKKNWKY